MRSLAQFLFLVFLFPANFLLASSASAYIHGKAARDFFSQMQAEPETLEIQPHPTLPEGEIQVFKIERGILCGKISKPKGAPQFFCTSENPEAFSKR